MLQKLVGVFLLEAEARLEKVALDRGVRPGVAHQAEERALVVALPAHQNVQLHVALMEADPLRLRGAPVNRLGEAVRVEMPRRVADPAEDPGPGLCGACFVWQVLF